MGGCLLLTDQRVLFSPHKLDSSTGGKAWECDLAAITNVGVAERGRNPFDGSMRRRLKIERDGAADFFVVSKVESVARAIREASTG